MYTWNALTRARQSENVHPLYVTELEKVHPPKKHNQKNKNNTSKHVLNTMSVPFQVSYLTFVKSLDGPFVP